MAILHFVSSFTPKRVPQRLTTRTMTPNCLLPHDFMRYLKVQNVVIMRMRRKGYARNNYLSCCSLNDPETCTDRLLDFFVLVLQQRERIGDVVPLPFGFAACKPGGKLVRKLFGVFVLDMWSVFESQGVGPQSSHLFDKRSQEFDDPFQCVFL